jgi:Na+-transporting methylmalonyl-CoA/oxaloacetate decarboxylase gamma subunit
MKNALLISLIGAGMVFVGLILLWIVMALLVRLTSEKEPKESSASKPESSADHSADKLKAAAAAVAAALALRQGSLTAETQSDKTASPRGQAWGAAVKSIQVPYSHAGRRVNHENKRQDRRQNIRSPGWRPQRAPHPG